MPMRVLERQRPWVRCAGSNVQNTWEPIAFRQVSDAASAFDALVLAVTASVVQLGAGADAISSVATSLLVSDSKAVSDAVNVNSASLVPPWQLSWDAGEGAIAYRIYTGFAPGVYDGYVQTPDASTTYLVNWTEVDVVYYLAIAAWDGVEESDLSDPFVVLNGLPYLFPLSVNASGRYLEDVQGRAFLIHGDTPWSIAAQLVESEIDAYLDDRAAKGFNVILFNAIEHNFTSQSPAYRNASGADPFTSMTQFHLLNEDYWQRVDYIVNGCLTRNIAVLMNPAYLGYAGGSQGWMSEITAESAGDLQTYGALLANRYTQPNVLWCMGGDYGGTTTERNKQWNIVTGIRSVRTTDIITAHNGPSASAYAAWAGFTGFNLNSAYPYAGDVYSACDAEYARTGPIPFFMIEARYDGEPDPPVSVGRVRLQAYTSILSGSCGHFYGNNPVWHFESPNTLFNYSGTWESNLNTTAGQDMVHVKDLFDAYAWHLLVPQTGTTLITTSKGSGDSRIVGARASDGSFAMVFTPSQNFTINMTALTPSSVRARWYNTSDGTYATASGSPFPNTGTQAFTAPGERVLVLDAA